MFDLLNLEFQQGIYDKSGIDEYVTLGFITQDQANQITSQAVNNN